MLLVAAVLNGANAIWMIVILQLSVYTYISKGLTCNSLMQTFYGKEIISLCAFGLQAGLSLKAVIRKDLSQKECPEKKLRSQVKYSGMSAYWYCKMDLAEIRLEETPALRYPLDAIALGTDRAFIESRAAHKAGWVAAYGTSSCIPVSSKK